jgi:hypothetical protein
LAGYWKFDEGAGDLAYDASGMNNTGTLVNAPYWERDSLPPVAGNRWALHFDGTNRAVSIKDSVSLRPASLTLAGWFRWLAVPTTNQSLVAKVVGSSHSDSYQLVYAAGDKQLRGVLGTASSFVDAAAYNWIPVVGTWYHIAFTFDNSSKIAVLYINGVQVATRNVGAGFTIGYDTGSLEIGRDNDFGNWVAFFNGQVDEVGVYYRALTASDIAALGGVIRPGGLVAFPATVTPTHTPTRTATPAPTGAPPSPASSTAANPAMPATVPPTSIPASTAIATPTVVPAPGPTTTPTRR